MYRATTKTDKDGNQRCEIDLFRTVKSIDSRKNSAVTMGDDNVCNVCDDAVPLAYPNEVPTDSEAGRGDAPDGCGGREGFAEPGHGAARAANRGAKGQDREDD